MESPLPSRPTALDSFGQVHCPIVLPVRAVRFSQSTISGPTRLRGAELTLQDLVAAFAHDGYSSDPIQVVRMPDGRLTSLDNRRLWAAAQAGLQVIPAIAREASELLVSPKQRRSLLLRRPLVDEDGVMGTRGRVVLPTGHLPSTLGEAVLCRCANQLAGPNGERFPMMGSFDLPRPTRERRLPSKGGTSRTDRSVKPGRDGPKPGRATTGLGSDSQLRNPRRMERPGCSEGMER